MPPRRTSHRSRDVPPGSTGLLVALVCLVGGAVLACSSTPGATAPEPTLVPCTRADECPPETPQCHAGRCMDAPGADGAGEGGRDSDRADAAGEPGSADAAGTASTPAPACVCDGRGEAVPNLCAMPPLELECDGCHCVVPGSTCTDDSECRGELVCFDGRCIAPTMPEGAPAPIGRIRPAAAAPQPEPLGCEPWPDDVEVSARKQAAFPSATLAGGLRTRSAVLWTELARADDVRVEVLAGEACDPIVSEWVAASDDTGRAVQIAVDGLRPDTRYRYVFETRGGERAEDAWFRTAPERDVPVRIGFSADIAHRDSYYGLFDDLVAAEPDLYLSLGDWPYADSGADAETADEFRAKYAETRRDRDIQRFMRAQGIHAIWDDHEVSNDWDGQLAEQQPDLVATGIQVWNEQFPIADAPEGEIYRRHAWGPGLDVILLDLRSHRDANWTDDDGAKTMLGETQRAWLLDALRESSATFKLVVISVPLAWGTTGSDHWPGFANERDLILDTIGGEGIEGVVFLTGDQHWMAVQHLPRGHKLWQTGALAQVPRRPRDRVPAWVVKQHKALNFGVLDYEPGPPATLRFTAIGNQRQSREDTDDPGEIYAETLIDGHGTIHVRPPEPDLAWTLRGAHTWVGFGAQTIERAPVGDYRIEWHATLEDRALPESTAWTLRHDRKITFAPPATDGRGAPTARLELADDLAASGLSVVDRCGDDPDSAWAIVDGTVRETGNCYDTDDSPSNPAERREWRALDKHRRPLALAKHGTWLRWDDAPELGDGWVGVKVAAYDNDAFGLVYGLQPDGAHYRVSMDAQREYIRLVRANADGTFERVAEDRTFEVARETWLRLAVERDGGVHRVWLDGEVVLEGDDDALGAGGVALYAWGMDDVRFADLVVRSTDAEAP